MNSPIRIGNSVLAVLWLLASLAGMLTLRRYSQTPAPMGRAVRSWPISSKLLPESNRPTFVIFLHPHCPCSKASFAVMQELVEKSAGQVKFYAVFVRPTNVASQWEQSDLYKRSVAFNKIATVVDDGGIEAKAFGALTSGQTYVYGPAGHLNFAGGITSGRGMLEIGPERKLIEQALAVNLMASTKTPVYGCSLL